MTRHSSSRIGSPKAPTSAQQPLPHGRSRIWAGVVSATLSGLVLCACGSQSSTELPTETGNPPVIDQDGLRLELIDGALRVIGQPGATEANVEVELENTTTGERASTQAGPDGAFEVEVPGSSSDDYELRVENSAGSDTLELAPPPGFECSPADYVTCDEEENFALDEVTSLGFSAASVLANIEGTYRFDIAWFDPCNDDRDCGLKGNCDQRPEDAPSTSYAGTETVLTIELFATGQPAVVPSPGPDQEMCARSLSIPARLTMISDDGAVDMSSELEIWTECGRQAAVGITGPASDLPGGIADELLEDSRVEFTFGTFDDRVWLGFYYSSDESGALPPVLQSEILSGESCPHDVAIADVLQAGGR